MERKNWNILLISFILLIGCTNNTTAPEEDETAGVDLESILNNPIIYEVNVRHFSEAGNLDAVTARLDKIKGLGVNILWLMPIHPIGAVKRKATGDQFVEDLPDSVDKSLYLGSPYSVKDYKKINPDFGTEADLRNLVEECHSRGIAIIFDWVANHTAWDNPWISDHPEWYRQKDGQITDPLDDKGNSMGWTDVAHLDYDSPELQDTMADAMEYWVREFDIDGFRCDVAMAVPHEFWNFARQRLDKIKPVFMLAESEGHNPQLFDSAFDAYYGWDMHFTLDHISKKEREPASVLRSRHVIDSIIDGRAFPMNFISNHDENSWKGDLFERMDDSWRCMATVVTAMDGMPLMYSGQEAGLNKRLAFFTKDEINWDADSADYYYNFYRDLLGLKQNDAMKLNSDQRMDIIDGRVLHIARGDSGDMVNFYFNLSDSVAQMQIPRTAKSIWKDGYSVQEGGWTLGPWGYVAFY